MESASKSTLNVGHDHTLDRILSFRVFEFEFEFWNSKKNAFQCMDMTHDILILLITIVCQKDLLPNAYCKQKLHYVILIKKQGIDRQKDQNQDMNPDKKGSLVV